MTVAPTLEPDAPDVVWQPQGPFDLGQTLGILPRGAADRTIMLAGSVAWLGFGTPTGAATIRLTVTSSGVGTQGAGKQAVTARAWGPGAAPALASVPALLGAGDDWTSFDHPDFQATLPRLVTQARRRNRAVRLPATGRMVDAIIPAVLEQKVTMKEARHGFRYLVQKFGSPAPGAQVNGPVPAGLMVAPTAEQWARIPSWDWHEAGVGPQRSATVMRVTRVASSLERLSALSASEAAVKLQTIPGIGIWTAAEVTQRTHGDADAISVGDYHLAAFVGRALTGLPVDDAGMCELLEPWRGHRQRVVRMLGLSGFHKPAFGPRMTIQDHRRH
ncbi:DNA-3-methyladenine glycosylase family protein [Arthrobacter sp. A5]|uniref:DNA-3-methyladenine glycosylase family protein n=1 Tax=Arthrobacter sp. A5 TaxID=576926 RepID=UPI003DA7C6F8